MISRGEHATTYGVDDTGNDVALFSKDQTYRVEDDPRIQWSEIITAEEHRARRSTKTVKKSKRDPRPKISLHYSTADESFKWWIGQNAKAGGDLYNRLIKAWRAHGHFWIRRKPQTNPLEDAVKMTAKLHSDYRVKLVVDGVEKPWSDLGVEVR